MMNVYTKEDTADILYKINKNLETINIKLTTIENKIETIENKIETIEKKIDSDIVDECKKMGNHINFVENVYENVKHPLGYINNKIKNFMGNEKTYSLTDNSDNN